MVAKRLAVGRHIPTEVLAAQAMQDAARERRLAALAGAGEEDHLGVQIVEDGRFRASRDVLQWA